MKNQIIAREGAVAVFSAKRWDCRSSKPLIESATVCHVAQVVEALPSPMCACNTGFEDNAYFFLHCTLFVPMRNDLLGQLLHLPGLDLSNIDSQALLDLLLYGSPKFNEIDNRIVLEASIAYIKATHRLN